MQQQQFPRRPQTIFNDFKYDMPKSTKPVEGAKFPATWMWEIGNNGKIYFKVNDGIYGQNDQNAKNKEVELTFIQRNQLFFILEEAVRDKDFTSSQVIISKQQWNRAANRMNDEPSVQATFTIVRTKEGEIRINFARGTYELMFVMNDNKLIVRSKDVDGVKENVGLASRAYVSAFVRFSQKFLDAEEWNRYTRETKESKSGGAGGGNNNRYQNNNSTGGGSNNAPKDFDDDIDMDF